MIIEQTKNYKDKGIEKEIIFTLKEFQFLEKDDYIKNTTKKYEEIKELGSGGYGKVILVSKDNTYYALKKIDISKFSNEQKKIVIMR